MFMPGGGPRAPGTALVVRVVVRQADGGGDGGVGEQRPRTGPGAVITNVDRVATAVEQVEPPRGAAYGSRPQTWAAPDPWKARVALLVCRGAETRWAHVTVGIPQVCPGGADGPMHEVPPRPPEEFHERQRNLWRFSFVSCL